MFTVTRAANSHGAVVVNLTWNGAAVFGTDYTVSASGGVLSTGGATLTLAAGVASATLSVTPVDDAAVEGAGSGSVTIAAGAGYVVGSPASASGSITDNDATTTPSLTWITAPTGRRVGTQRPGRIAALPSAVSIRIRARSPRSPG